MYKQMTRMSRKGFTIVELIIVIVIGAILLTIVVGGGSWLFSGCSAQVGDNLIVNSFHNSTAQITVRGTYFGATEVGNLYRVVATVIKDSDYATPCESGVCPTETFEVSDSFIDGNFRTADLFGELHIAVGTLQVFEIELRGERSGVSGGGSFRQIRSVTAIGESE